MKFRLLWSPWRSVYIKRFSEKHEGACLFCSLPRLSDEEGLIIYRGKRAYVVLNAYPYNTGHIMVVPYKHVASIEDLDEDDVIEVMRIVRACVKVIKKAMKPDGINIGINMGRAAGAGIEEHIHVHIVPRWCGDANFMPIIGDSKSLPMALNEVYKLLREYWLKIYGGDEALDH